jgi:hypothetical protein
MAFAMAISNSWGYLLVLALMGHGMVTVPQKMWLRADPVTRLKKLEARAPAYLEELEDAEMDRRDMAHKVFQIARRVEEVDHLRSYIGYLLLHFGPPEGSSPTATVNMYVDGEDDEIPLRITLPYLVQIHWKAKRVVRDVQRYQSQWDQLLQEAWHLQDVVDNMDRQDDRRFMSTLYPMDDNRLNDAWRSLQWWWYTRIELVVSRTMAALATLLSIVLLWSELTFQFTSPMLSVFAWALRGASVSYTLTELVCLVSVIYMCVCTYTSLLQVKVFNMYAVVGHHQTDAASLLFVGSYLLKMAHVLLSVA